MSAPTTTAPALPDALYEQAVSAFSLYPDAHTGERALLRALLYGAIRAALADAEARGRAAMLDQVKRALPHKLCMAPGCDAVAMSFYMIPGLDGSAAACERHRNTNDVRLVAFAAAAALAGGDA